MSKHGKRKRESVAEDEAQQPPSKAQVLQDGRRKVEDTDPEKKSSERRQVKSERKRKSAIHAERQGTTDGKPAEDGIAAGQNFVSLKPSQAIKKDKRRSPRSIRKEARERKALTAAAENQTVTAGNKTAIAENKKEHTNTPDAGRDARFICFVGNLPYSATTEQIASHFSKIQPQSIRLSTDKKTGKSKGFAFLEFDNFDKMKTCLKIYHHSIFDPESTKQADGEQAQQNSKSKGRKINVELTAGGGGGKSTSRKDKIKARNSKLNEERARDWAKKKQKEAESKFSKGDKQGRSEAGAASEDVNSIPLENKGDIHPSRLSRVQI